MPRISRLPISLTLLAVSALLAGCNSAPTEAPDPVAEEEIELTEAFRVTLGSPLQKGRITDAPTAILANLESHKSVLDGGKASHPPHTHRNEEVIVPIVGELDVYRGPWEDEDESTERIGPGKFIFHASNHPHNITAIGPEESRYWVMSWEGDPTGADDHALPPSTFDYSVPPEIDESLGVGREVLAESQTPNVENLLIESVAVSAGSEISASVSDVDTVMFTLTDGLVIGGEAAPRYTVVYYPAGTEFGIANSSEGQAQLIQFSYAE